MRCPFGSKKLPLPRVIMFALKRGKKHVNLRHTQMFVYLNQIINRFYRCSGFWINSGSRRAMPPKKKNSDLEPKAKGKAKPKASAAIAPLLDAENAAALASTGQVSDSFKTNHSLLSSLILPRLRSNSYFPVAPTGAKYNLELITSTFEALEELTRNTWPGIFDEEPLPLGMGANQVSWNQWCWKSKVCFSDFVQHLLLPSKNNLAMWF